MVHIGKELLNPKNGYVFKRIFGHKGNEEITKQMLKQNANIEFIVLVTGLSKEEVEGLK